jgi:hypothetical protein
MMAAEARNQFKSQPLEPGIRGWLLVFVIWLGVVSPLWTVGLSAVLMWRLEQVNPTDAALMRDIGWDVLLWVVTILRAAMRIIAALAMYFRRMQSSVWLALAMLWLSGPLLILGPWIIRAGEVHVPGLVRSGVIALAWSVFLFVSLRVKLTYGIRPGR